ncbi:DUF2793 domain-containing protein [Aurantimonas sp. 22II-16-19i]|uniref:DUF2793 domain-containing protein n=1 Tax=Aurantimonas sp. 22II-16-19i TaxID=1317114 RepID=UPI0009F7B16E|nr:DUF2793 domain-containing protein [Aurantimonas sp. 22II-16-19i]ORE93964.1 hypothetical protein ATO4_14459 [Aurantimonas sp. 22II-16-19i]
MPDTTDRLALPYILAEQAQKHVSHNEALVRLDALVHLAVADRDRSEPPAESGGGDRHLVAAGASGAWAGRAGSVAVWQDGAWMFLEPQAGWRAWCAAEAVLLVHDGTGWTPAGLSAADLADGSLARLGINTPADEVNRLAVKTSAVLISHDDLSGSGNGSVLGIFNKASGEADAGLSFEVDWSTRALLGLFGSEDFRIKVSPDGGTFNDALVVDGDTGRIGIGTGSPMTSLSIAGTGGANGVSIEDTAAASASGRWNATSFFDGVSGANNLRLVNAGAGFGTGGTIAEFRKTSAGAPRIGFCGLADDGALAAVTNNLNAAAANGIKSVNTALSPGSYATFLSSVSATTGQRMFSGRGNDAETFYVMGDGSAYFAGKLGIGTAPAGEAIRANGAIVHAADNLHAFGSASLRAAAVYAATGTINTSDATQKRLRGEPDDAEMRAWSRVRPKIFQWNDAIAAKGEDGARLHAGYVAQEVAEAFAAEGLDPARYGLFCVDEVTEVRAVEKSRRVTRPLTRQVVRRRQDIAVRDDEPVLIVVEETVDEPVMRQAVVRDETGELVLDDAGLPLTHPVPEMETVDLTDIVHEEVKTGKTRFGLRYDQCLVLELAYLRRQRMG